MAPLQYFSFRQVLVLYLVLFLFASTLVCACSESQSQRTVRFLGRRRLLDIEKEEQLIKKKPSSSLSTKNQTKPVKQSAAAEKEDQPKKKVDIGTSYTKKNQTKLLKPSSNSTKTSSSTLDKSQIKKLNSTSKSLISTKTTTSTPPKIQLKKLNSTSKASNSTKPSSVASKKSSDLSKPSTPKEKTTKPITIKPSKPQTADKLPVLESKSKNSDTEKKEKPKQQKPQKPPQPSWVDQEEDADFVTELRDLPAKFQQTLMPDLERISTTSRAYIFKANKEITRGFKPIVGNKYAPTIAPVISFAFILLPLLLVSLIFNQIKAYLSLQKILIFIQVYLSIYFSILCLSSLVTGLEPLKFFYATSQSTYIWLQVLQTLAYVLYLLLLLMYLILVFSTDCSLGSKLLGLLQTFVGFAVGLHYYVTVFHRVVLHQPPRTNWKVHGVYATCFLVICLFSRAERRKKAYLAEGGEEGKLS